VSMPHRYRGQGGAIISEGCVGAFEQCENFWQASHVATSFAASLIIAGQ
jgi:hypothetical protein